MKRILAIETSCDETACAVVEDGVKVLSSIVASQIPLHQITHGVVPEVAARAHVAQILPVIEESMKQANLAPDAIDAVAVTQGPGLVGSLIVGVTAAQVLSRLWYKPLLRVNHILGHLYANFLGREQLPQLPILILSVSGGHNDLVLLSEHGKYQVLGQTQDDSAGEAFDKVARMLDLPYPGGPEIDKLAKLGKPGTFQLPRAWLQQVPTGMRPKEITDFNFSFSGLKTAVYVLIKKLGILTSEQKADLAYEFQEAVCDVMVSKLVAAWEKYQTPSVFISGGVSANQRFRSLLEASFINKPVQYFYPLKLSYCTDNAAMIGAAAYFNPQVISETLEPEPSLWL
ncbi:MAG: tRNA (adenosine(37)-N6)-threonylcarbamoyltransferase complex transferase subunit TsaD [Candidatus Abawacabacteria bacterium]|nr:tRNA (adenosine(37)-N6)-threonylcarbamoyltransferase complex transferase subunit TsaD [Candidatus Abawacabacteria bacterium]